MSKMKRTSLIVMALATIFLFGFSIFVESSAWARAGGGGSFGSRGSRSFSAPRMPSSPSPSSPGISTPGRPSFPGSPTQPSSPGLFSRSPFLQGLAGGVAGGLLGNMLFGGAGHAAPGAGTGGGGIGFLDILILGLIAYFLWKFFKKRRQESMATAYSGDPGVTRLDDYSNPAQPGFGYSGSPAPEPAYDEVERGMEQLRRYDPGLNEESLKETFQDMFFRIQAGWMNRSLEGIETMFTSEMADYFRGEFDLMKKKGRINRLENIAIRKVEPAEVWQEAGKDYVTVLFTANLLDYTVDESGQLIGGDKLNPVKFQEFWTFCRDIGSGRWQLSAINQADEQTQVRH